MLRLRASGQKMPLPVRTVCKEKEDRGNSLNHETGQRPSRLEVTVAIALLRRGKGVNFTRLDPTRPPPPLITPARLGTTA
jgi:hypothetical protein